MSLVLNEQQRESVHAMIHREQEGCLTMDEGCVLYSRLGINGNPAGSGKTRAMLSLVHQDHLESHMTTRPYVHIIGRGLVSHQETMVRNQDHQTTIVLANGSIRRQWIEELRRANCLRYILLDTVRKLTSFHPAETDVAVVSNTVYKRLATWGHRWRRFIYDETDSYVFPGMQVLLASFTWFVTATWQELDRFTRGPHTPSTHAIRRLLMGVPLHHLVVVVPTQLGLPEIQEHVHTCRRAVSMASAVVGHITPEILLQIEDGNIQGAIQSLGGDSSTTNVVDLVRSRLENALQEARLRVQLNRGDQVLWRFRVEQLQRDMSLVDDRFDAILKEEPCSICMESFSHPILTPCHHVFCLQCIVPWLDRQHTCPQCRTSLLPEQITTLLNPLDTTTVASRPAVVHTTRTRIEHLERLLSERRCDQRILIFSENDVSLAIIQTVLGPEPYGMLRGHSSTRIVSINRFKSGEVPILLLNSRMNGAGLDLPETTDIILFHPMHPALEKQAIGRGQRLGRTSPLHVHRFL
jgi:hypothetical protein